MVKKRTDQAGGAAQGEPESLLPLRPTVFSIMLVLNSEDMHGYGIMKRLNEGSAGLLGPGTLYRTLKEMRDLGLVEHAESPVDVDGGDERRSYYTLTDFGGEVVAAEAARIASLMKEAKLGGALGGGK